MLPFHVRAARLAEEVRRHPDTARELGVSVRSALVPERCADEKEERDGDR